MLKINKGIDNSIWKLSETKHMVLMITCIACVFATTIVAISKCNTSSSHISFWSFYCLSNFHIILEDSYTLKSCKSHLIGTNNIHALFFVKDFSRISHNSFDTIFKTPILFCWMFMTTYLWMEISLSSIPSTIIYTLPLWMIA